MLSSPSAISFDSNLPSSPLSLSSDDCRDDCPQTICKKIKIETKAKTEPKTKPKQKQKPTCTMRCRPHSDIAKEIRANKYTEAHFSRIVYAHLDGNVLETADASKIHRFWAVDKKTNTLKLKSESKASSMMQSTVCSSHGKNTPAAPLLCCIQATQTNHTIDHSWRKHFEVYARRGTEIQRCFHKNAINCISTSARGTFIVSGDAGGVLKIWTGAGAPIYEIDKHLPGIGGAVVSDCGCIIVAWCKEGYDLYIFDITNYDDEIKRILTLAHKEDPRTVLHEDFIGVDVFNEIMQFARL